MARGRDARGKPMNSHMRRKLSEEGKRLLRHALAHDDDDDREGTSVNFSVMTNRDDSSVDSELESMMESGGGRRSSKKWSNKYQTGDDGLDHQGQDLEDAMEELTEKRDTTKIQALKRILTILCGSVMSERAQSFKDTLASHALACMKKRMQDSAPLALRTLSVLAITLGPDEQDFYDDMLTPVQRLLADSSEHPNLRLEAAYALSIACVVCSPVDQSKWELLDNLGSILIASKEAEEEEEDEFPESLVIAVMECWAYVISSFRPSTIVNKMYDPDTIVYDHVVAIAGFVREGVNPSVRSAACEVLALLVQYKYTLNQNDWTYELEGRGSPIGGLDAKIASYMRETGKNIGKKNRKVQRSMLKEVLETLETGEGPHKDLQIEDETLSISTWGRYYQANVFRRALQSGFQVHLLENNVPRDVFDVTENSKAKFSMISTITKRADNKTRAVHKRNNVSRKDTAQNAFLYGD